MKIIIPKLNQNNIQHPKTFSHLFLFWKEYIVQCARPKLKRFRSLPQFDSWYTVQQKQWPILWGNAQRKKKTVTKHCSVWNLGCGFIVQRFENSMIKFVNAHSWQLYWFSHINLRQKLLKLILNEFNHPNRLQAMKQITRAQKNLLTYKSCVGLTELWNKPSHQSPLFKCPLYTLFMFHTGPSAGVQQGLTLWAMRHNVRSIQLWEQHKPCVVWK